MALVAYTGFESQDRNELIAGENFSYLTINTSITKDSEASIKVDAQIAATYAYLPVWTDPGGSASLAFSNSEKYTTFDIYFESFPPTDREFFFKWSLSSTHLCLSINGAGLIEVIDSDYSTVLGSFYISLGTWINVKMYIGSSGWEVKINNSVIASGSDFRDVNTCWIGKFFNLNDGTYIAYYDNFFVDDTNYTDCDRIAVLRAISFGTYTNVSPSIFSFIDEIPASSTDLLTLNLPPSVCSVRVQTLSQAGILAEKIGAVSAICYGSKLGTNTAAVWFKSGQSETSTSAVSWPNTPGMALKRFDHFVDPNTGLSWTLGAVDSIEPGGKCVTRSTQGSRICALHAIIAYKSPSITNLKSFGELSYSDTKQLNGLILASIKDKNGLA